MNSLKKRLKRKVLFKHEVQKKWSSRRRVQVAAESAQLGPPTVITSVVPHLSVWAAGHASLSLGWFRLSPAGRGCRCACAQTPSGGERPSEVSRSRTGGSSCGERPERVSPPGGALAPRLRAGCERAPRALGAVEGPAGGRRGPSAGEEVGVSGLRRVSEVGASFSGVAHR